MNEFTEIQVDIVSERTATASAKVNIFFEEAFGLYHRTVFRAARSVVSDCGLAEDVTQETFLSLHNNLHSITNDEMLKPWLIRVAINIARNTILGQMRANKRDENYVKETGVFEVASIEVDYEENADLSEIYKALANIKEPLRSCLLVKQQGLSHKEIAASLELNESSIGTFAARGRKNLPNSMGKVKGKV